MPKFRHPHQEEGDKPPVLQPPAPFGVGLLQVYTGDGKGKSTAAFGLGLRAVGHGLRVHVVQFMKGDAEYGELKAALLLPGYTVARFGSPGLMDMHNPTEEARAEARRALEHARQAMLSGEYDVIILDEVNVAQRWGLIPLEDLLALVANKPPKVELVFTGRYAHPRLLEVADLVTEMKMRKHPYQKGILSRQGIDY